MNDDWFQASLEGDLEGAARIQERVAREASKMHALLERAYDPGLESLLPITPSSVPRDHFYDAFQRLDAIMSIEGECVEMEKSLIFNYGAWQAALAGQIGRENWAMSEDENIV